MCSLCAYYVIIIWLLCASCVITMWLLCDYQVRVEVQCASLSLDLAIPADVAERACVLIEVGHHHSNHNSNHMVFM